MNSIFQLEIPKRNQHCALQGERLLPGMEIISLLSEEDEAGMTRRDYCSECWTQFQNKMNSAISSKCYWKSKIEKKQIVETSSRIDRALHLLRALLQEGSGKEGEIFVLCLFLAHARQLALRKEFQDNEVNYHLYEILKNEEFLTIKVVPLSQVEIGVWQRSIAEQLQRN